MIPNIIKIQKSRSRTQKKPTSASSVLLLLYASNNDTGYDCGRPSTFETLYDVNIESEESALKSRDAAAAVWGGMEFVDMVVTDGRDGMSGCPGEPITECGLR